MEQENFEQEQINEQISNTYIPSIKIKQYHKLFQTNSFNNSFNHQVKMGKKGRSKSIEYAHQINKQNCSFENVRKNQIKKMEQKEIQACTFQPHVNNKGRQRTLEQFLQSQKNFSKRVNEKKQNLINTLKQSQKKDTFKPKINNRSSFNEKRQQPIYERLYKLRNKQSITEIPLGNFIPQIGQKSKRLIRDLPFFENLYNDAIRRQESKQKNIFSNLPSQKSATNITNIRLVAQKFIKQYYASLQNIGLDQDCQHIQKEVYKVLLYKMNFIGIQQKLSQEEKKLIEQSYKFMQSNGVSPKNICIFFICLIGIYNINPKLPKSQEINNQTDFNIQEIQGRKIQKKYDIFYRNRLYAQQFPKKCEEQQYSFKPEINPQSQFLASNYRNKILEQTTDLIQNNQIKIDIPKSGLITHVDLLNLTKLTKEFEMKKKRQQLIEQNLKQCTFKPKIIEGKRSLNTSMVNQSQLGLKKYEQLYNLSKTLNKNVKTTEQILNQKKLKECTFAPNINKTFIPKQIFNNSNKDIEKTLIRMNQGRKQRQQKNKKINNIYEESNKSKNHHKNSSVQHNNQIPYLIIDINLGQSTQQITIYKDQVDHPEQIAKKFGKKHNLQKETIQKLASLLKKQINNMLEKIQEQEYQLDSRQNI